MPGPGGAFSSKLSHSPPTPSTAASATVAACQATSRSVNRRVVAAGTTISVVASSAPTADSEATAVKATSSTSTPSAPRAAAGRRAAVKPAASQRGPSDHVASAGEAGGDRREHLVRAVDRSRLPNSSRSTRACEPNTSLARITPARARRERRSR